MTTDHRPDQPEAALPEGWELGDYPCAQLVDGRWIRPQFECDSLQMALDEVRQENARLLSRVDELLCNAKVRRVVALDAQLNRLREAMSDDRVTEIFDSIGGPEDINAARAFRQTIQRVLEDCRRYTDGSGSGGGKGMAHGEASEGATKEDA